MEKCSQWPFAIMVNIDEHCNEQNTFIMPKFTTSFPDSPCADFYDWYKFIHGRVPIEVREKIDRFGNRRTPESDERRFANVIQVFKKSLLKQ